MPSPARLYDYHLGGTGNFPADREAAEAMLRVMPERRRAARENRAFLRRVVRHLVAEGGFEQFLGLGSGPPTRGNVHEVAREFAPDAHVVCVGNDPMVLAHGEALPAGTPARPSSRPTCAGRRRSCRSPRSWRRSTSPGRSRCCSSRRCGSCPTTRRPRSYGPSGSRSGRAAGSVISTITSTGQAPEKVRTITDAYGRSTAPAALRSRRRIEALFGDLDLIPPGLVSAPEWRPGAAARTDAGTSWVLAGVGAVS